MCVTNTFSIWWRFLLRKISHIWIRKKVHSSQKSFPWNETDIQKLWLQLKESSHINEVSRLQILFLQLVIQKLIGRHNTRSQAKMLINHIYNLYLFLTMPRNHVYSSYLDVLFPFPLFLLKPFFSSEPSNARKMSHILVFLYKYITNPDQLSILFRSMNNSVYM